MLPSASAIRLLYARRGRRSKSPIVVERQRPADARRRPRSVERDEQPVGRARGTRRARPSRRANCEKPPRPAPSSEHAAADSPAVGASAVVARVRDEREPDQAARRLSSWRQLAQDQRRGVDVRVLVDARAAEAVAEEAARAAVLVQRVAEHDVGAGLRLVEVLVVEVGAEERASEAELGAEEVRVEQAQEEALRLAADVARDVGAVAAAEQVGLRERARSARGRPATSSRRRS